MKAKGIMEPRINIITLGVADLPRSIRFYRDGLRFPTSANDDEDIAFFTTAGTRPYLGLLSRLAYIGPAALNLAF